MGEEGLPGVHIPFMPELATGAGEGIKLAVAVFQNTPLFFGGFSSEILVHGEGKLRTVFELEGQGHADGAGDRIALGILKFHHFLFGMDQLRPHMADSTLLGKAVADDQQDGNSRYTHAKENVCGIGRHRVPPFDISGRSGKKRGFAGFSFIIAERESFIFFFEKINEKLPTQHIIFGFLNEKKW